MITNGIKYKTVKVQETRRPSGGCKQSQQRGSATFPRCLFTVYLNGMLIYPVASTKQVLYATWVLLSEAI